VTEKRYNIDLHENTTSGKIFRVVLGVVCLIATVWFLFSIRGTAASVSTAWIAILFLLLFSLWLIGSGLRLTDRYITVGEESIRLRQNFLKPPMIFTSSTLTHVEFKPLAIDFYTKETKVTLKLGTYYPEHSASIMEAVEKFCGINSVEIRGLELEEEKDKS
jgi:uncharacterized membrane protein